MDQSTHPMQFVVKSTRIAHWIAVRVASPQRRLRRMTITAARSGAACRRLK